MSPMKYMFLIHIFFLTEEFQQGMLMKRRSVCGAVVVSFTLNPDIHKISYAAC